MPHDALPADTAEDLLERAFVEGFRAATDKASFLRLAGIPLETDIDGEPGYKLMEVRLADSYAVGSAAPGFGGGGLVYHPFPGELVRLTTELVFVYCSTHGSRLLTWDSLHRHPGRAAPIADGSYSSGHKPAAFSG